MSSDLPATVVASRDALPSLTVCNRHARARVYLHGAHVTSYRPVGETEVLWMSVRSAFEDGKPIRGGVPICFPWFGGNAANPASPAHGFARLRSFTLVSAEDLPDGRTRLALALRASAETRALWAHAFELVHTITVGPELELALEVRNVDERPFTFEEALHTYFDVRDVRQAQVTGLERARCADRIAGGERTEGAEPITFTGETDRLYLGTTAPCLVHDGDRVVRVEKSGSASTIVWNPWIVKAARMPDFGDDEWPGMVCVESANAASDAITLAPGESHRMTVTLSARRRSR